MILVIDNYDSFTYNLVQYLGELGAEVRVARNDAISLEAIADEHPSRIVISPGPGRPEQAGVTMSLIRHFGQTTPILGVPSSVLVAPLTVGMALMVLYAAERLIDENRLIAEAWQLLEDYRGRMNKKPI